MTNRWLNQGCLGLALASSAVGGVSRADDWGQFGLDGARGRMTAERSGPSFLPQWNHALKEGRLISSPVVVDGRVLLAGSNGEVVALRAVDGHAVWKTDLGVELAASPAIDRGRAIVPSLSSKVFSIRLADGSVTWTQVFGGHDFGSPVLLPDAKTGKADSFVLAAGFPAQKLGRLSVATGEPVWETKPGAIGDLVKSSAAIVGGRAIIGMNGGRYQSVDLDTGAVGWTYESKGAVNLSSPLVMGDRAYLLPGDSKALLHAINVDDGKSIEGFPFSLKDPTAAPTGKLQDVGVAMSSPMTVDGLIIAQVRYEYTMILKDPALPTFYMREYAMAVDPAGPTLVWSKLLGERTTINPNDFPELNLCATPAGFAEKAGTGSYVAVTSSLAAKVSVLDVKSGNVTWSSSTSGPSRSSPVLANGQLFVATDAGVLHAFASQSNQAPSFPTRLSPGAGRPVDRIATQLRWEGATDPESSSLSYQVRVDDDGEVLESWLVQKNTLPGQTSIELPVDLKDGSVYSFAVRSRDAAGAWSEWSAIETFKAEQVPSVDVNGKPFTSVADAVAHAQPGETIVLGAGTFRLGSTLSLSQGVNLIGAGGQLTILDATGLNVAIVATADGKRAGVGSSIEKLTVTGGHVGIKVSGGELTTMRNVIIRDHDEAGVSVDAGQKAELINGTVTWNGIGARASGALTVRNSLIVENNTGLSAVGSDAMLTSRYNNLFGNAIAYDGMKQGQNDLATAIAFMDPATRDLRMLGPQTTTDKGDPADPFDNEPMPNGGRINLVA